VTSIRHGRCSYRGYYRCQVVYAQCPRASSVGWELQQSTHTVYVQSGTTSSTGGKPTAAMLLANTHTRWCVIRWIYHMVDQQAGRSWNRLDCKLTTIHDIGWIDPIHSVTEPPATGTAEEALNKWHGWRAPKGIWGGACLIPTYTLLFGKGVVSPPGNFWKYRCKSEQFGGFWSLKITI